MACSCRLHAQPKVKKTEEAKEPKLPVAKEFVVKEPAAKESSKESSKAA